MDYLDNDLDKELLRLDNVIWSHYRPDDEPMKMPVYKHELIGSLRADIEHIMLETPESTWQTNIIDELEASPIHDRVMDFIDMKKIKNLVNTRKHWETTLKRTKDIHKLSAKIQWGFYDKDLKQLAKLHKENKYRDKIEALLENCNFHEECSQFINGEYDNYLK